MSSQKRDSPAVGDFADDVKGLLEVHSVRDHLQGQPDVSIARSLKERQDTLEHALNQLTGSTYVLYMHCVPSVDIRQELDNNGEEYTYC